MKLTVAICGLQERIESLTKVYKKLISQSKGKPVEVICVIDNRSLSLGAKRNLALDRAKGEYISFVDDDDDISDNYIDLILQWAYDCDVLTYKTQYWYNGNKGNVVFYSTRITEQRNLQDRYERFANAICCWRTEFARKVRYSDITFGEDTDFGLRAIALQPNEKFINAVMYHHLYSTTHTTTRPDEEKEKKEYEVIEISGFDQLDPNKICIL